MPLLTPQTKVQLDELKCKLPADLIADLEAYATAIHSDVNYVVQKAVEKLTVAKEFREWKSANQDKLSLSPAVNPKAKRGPKTKAEAAPIAEKAVA